MFPFNLLSIKVWLILGAIAVVASNGYTAFKVYDHVRTKYETINLKNEVKYVEREVKVAVLDGKTLSAALEKQKQRFEQEKENERLINEIIRAHEKDTANQWCELSPDELRVWNNENRGTFGDIDSVVGTRLREQLPSTPDVPQR
jgi:hypothetical protein